MFRRQVRSAWCSWVIVLLAILVTVSQTRPASAADKLGNAVDFIPADATFYCSSMRGKEQLDLLLGSKAWAKVQNLPAVQMGWGALQGQLNQPGSPWSVVDQLMQLPENQELLELGGDMASHEMFAYGDNTWLGFIELLSELNNYRYRSLFSKINDDMSARGLGGPRNVQEGQRQQFRAVIESLNKHLDLIKFPNLVVGFKISDPAPAKRQLKRLEVMAGLVLGQNPMFKDRLKRVKVGDDDFLTLALDGSLVPWDQLPFDKLEDNPGEFDKLKETLEKLTLVISLGVRDKYLLLSIGGTNAGVEKLGQGKPLSALPEFGRLKKFSAERLTGVSFASKSLMAQSGVTKKDVDALAAMFAEHLVPNAPVSDEVKTRIGKDVVRLAADIKASIPEPGACLSFGFLTGKGYEEYVYNWAQNLVLDDSKPLNLVQHVGGAPMAAVVGRSKSSVGAYGTLTKWLKVFHGYFEEIALPQMPGKQREQYMAVRDMFLPLVQRADAATRTLLIPALADGQSALVFDTKIKSLQWQSKMPPAQTPLPMLEIALVFGVSDANLLKKACVEYKSIADDGLVKLRELNPGKIPDDFKIPDPLVRTTKNGVVYIYPLPKEAGLDDQLALNGGLGSKVGVLSFVPKQSARLLASLPLAADGILANTEKRNLAVLTYFNWPALIDAVEPWTEYGVRAFAARGAPEAAAGDSLLLDETARAKVAEAANDSDQTKMILDHVRAVAEVLKCFRSMGSITYSENGAIVTHMECRMKDVD